MSAAEFLRIRKDVLDVTQKELTWRIGRTEAMIRAYETGKKPIPIAIVKSMRWEEQKAKAKKAAEPDEPQTDD